MENKIAQWDLSMLANFSHTTLTSYDFIYMYSYFIIFMHLYILIHVCLYIYDFRIFQISVFLEFPHFCKSQNMEIWKFQKIQKTEIMYACGQACMYVCLCVWRCRWSMLSLIHHYPLNVQQAYTMINVHVCEHNSDGDECRI